MSIEVIYHPDGTTTTVTHPDTPNRLDAGAQRIAMVRGRAAELDKKGKYSEASALRATIGE